MISVVLAMNKSIHDAGGIDYVGYASALSRVCDVTLVSAERPGMHMRRTLPDSIKHIAVRASTLSKKSLEPMRVAKRIIEELKKTGGRFDIFQAPAFPEFGLAFFPVPRGSARVLVMDIRSNPVSSHIAKSVGHRLWTAQARRADLVIAIDAALIAPIRQDKVPALFGVVPLGFDREVFDRSVAKERSEIGLEDDDIVFVYTGSVSRHRKIETMVRVFEEAHSRFNKVKLLVVKSEEEVGFAYNPDAVRMVGPVSHDLIPQFLRMSDVGVAWVPPTPVYDVQPPLKTVEYLAAGLPVLATDTRGNRNFAQHGRNGLLVDWSEERKMLEAIEVLSTPSVRHELGSWAQESVAHLSYDSIVTNQLLPLYMRALERSESHDKPRRFFVF